MVRNMATDTAQQRSGAIIDETSILNAMSSSVLALDGEGVIVSANLAAEQMFQSSLQQIIGARLDDILPTDNPVFSLVQQVREHHHPVSEYDVSLETPKIGKHVINLQVAPILETPGAVVLTLQVRSIADKIDRQLTHRGAARSVTAMASMLAHEIKNPLSGIRGAAQLLEQSCEESDIELPRLIRDETDRICALLDRMDIFSDSSPLNRQAENIHLVLDRVYQLARNGFAKGIRIVTDFDPSLPPVLGNRDQLIQVFLNLIKNAAEAVPDEGGEIILATTYQHGVRFAISGIDARVHVPLTVSIKDNGPGIPEDIQSCLFDPFVTTKPNGTGLGLAMVAKIIGDHGGVIEYQRDERRKLSEFKIMLPIADTQETAQTRGI